MQRSVNRYWGEDLLKTIFFALLVTLSTIFIETDAAVTLTESEVPWKTFSHTVNSDNSLLNDTFSTDIVTHTYKSLVLENEYLKVTLVPGYGGRIISLIYKPTGHEQLYQNPVGTPYGPDWDAFFYDWLMVWGGIFPTFPEPEHGKMWCLPWDYEITVTTPDTIAVTMSITDDITFTPPGTRFKYGTTGITCRFTVTLAAGASVLKTSVSLENAKNTAVSCEYWTNVGVAPGSQPGAPRCDDQTEIVGPVSKVKIGSDWPEIRAVEQLESEEIYRFDKLRWYKNWADDGIAYAWPVEGNFWGALNHGNNEAILRISENVKTPGLKLWGFGYNRSRSINPQTSTDYHRPFIEMWAGASKEFFTPAEFPANSTVQFDEYYTPTAGLTAFTHASPDAVVDLTTDKSGYNGTSDQNVEIHCNYIVTHPADEVSVYLLFKGGDFTVPVYDTTRTHIGNGPFSLQKSVPVMDLCSTINRLMFELRTKSATLMSAEVPVSIANAGTCATSMQPESRTHHPLFRADAAERSPKFYAINGTCLGSAADRRTVAKIKSGVILSVDNQGRCARVVRVRQ